MSEHRLFGHSLAENNEIRHTKMPAAYLHSYICKRAHSPLFPMIHKQMRQKRLQRAVIVLAHVALLDSSVHIVAVWAVARGEVFAHGY